MISFVPPYNCYLDMSADPDMIAFGVIVCVSVPTLLLLLYMSVFGRRMGWTAIRWHVINCTIWGLLHLAHTSSFAEKAPFANWITDQEWSDRKVQVECLTRSIFPAGTLFCKPEIQYSRDVLHLYRENAPCLFSSPRTQPNV